MSPSDAPTSRERTVADWLRSPGAIPRTSGPDLGPLQQFEELASGNPELLSSIATAAESYRRQFAKVGALAGALIEAQERLDAIGDLTDLVVRVLDTDSAFDSMLEVARDLTLSDAALLITPSETLPLTPERLSGDAGALGSALRARVTEAMVSGGPSSVSPHEDGRVATTTLGLRGARAFGGETLGGLGFSRSRGEQFTTADLRLIDTIAGTIELGLSLHVMHESSLKRIAVAQEHRIASSIAQATLTAAAASMPGLDVASATVPAHVSGGDFHVTMESGGALWFAVGDVSGKGLPAAIVMTRTVSALRAAFAGASDRDLDVAWNYLLDDLFDYLEQLGMFVTLAFGYVDLDGNTVSVCNAGHSPMTHVKAGIASSVPATAPPLGIIRSLRPSRVQLPLDDESMLVIGSDGLTEQENSDGQMFGYDRFDELCSTLVETSSAGLVDAIFSHVDEFAQQHPRSDDQTAFVLKTTSQLTDSTVSAPELKIAAEASQLREIGPWLAAALEHLDPAESTDAHSRLELAAHEICMNVIDHGGVSSKSLVTLTVDVTAAAVRVHIVDHGRSFDPDAAPVPVAGQAQVGGYGLLIARRLSDELRYARESETNRWMLVVKRRGAPAPESEESLDE
ncbi:ATP-binding SpoIIE family protein phosphatase [Microbacterium marmarense]|uniref:SpoIIE family protein phosphatase n=1 Tax=Microbacterium marmarense TaxID=3122051 RepID=A0ABU8LS69_9MICO